MVRFAIIPVIRVAAFVYCHPASAQCMKDTDCKGDRICERGDCVSPSPPAAAPAPAAIPAPAIVPAPAPVGAQTAPPAPATAPPRQRTHFQKGYGEISSFMTFHTWGRMYVWSDGDAFDAADPQFKSESGFTGGIRMAGLGVITSVFHLGGYFSLRAGSGAELTPDNDDAELLRSYAEGDSDILLWGLGMTMKFGGQLNPFVYMGGGLDVGLSVLKIDEWDGDPEFDNDNLLGVEFHPRFIVEIIALDTGGFKLTVPISVGPVIAPFSMRTLNEEGEVKAIHWSISPAMTVGIALGG